MVLIKSHSLYQTPNKSRTEWKGQSIDASSEVTEMLEISDKDFKTATILKSFSEKL